MGRRLSVKLLELNCCAIPVPGEVAGHRNHPCCCMGRKMYTVYSWLRGRRTCTFDFASQWQRHGGTEREKDGETVGSKRGRGASSAAAMPSRVSGHSTRLHGRICWWEQGASVSLASQPAQPHQKPKRLPANLSILSKCSQSWRLFWTRSEAHVHWKRSSARIQVRRQQKRDTSMFSSAADQEGRP